MYNVGALSAEFLAAVRYFQRQVTVVEWRNGTSGDWSPLRVRGGSVQHSRRSNTRWTLDTTLPYGSVPIDPYSGLSSYGSYLRVFKGINLPRIGPIMVPWGVYRVDNLKDNHLSGYDLVAYSREIQLVDGRFPAPRRIGGATAISVVQQLVGEVCPDVAFSWRVDGARLVTSFIEERDRWGVLDGGVSGTAIATWLNAEMYFDGRDVFTIARVPSLTDPVAWEMQPDLADAAGVVISPSTEYDRSSVYNIVSGIVETSDGTPPIGPVFVWDGNPGSPTYAGPDPINDPAGAAAVSKFGPKPLFYNTPLAASWGELQTIVSSLLQDAIGLSKNISFDLSSNPALEAGDVVRYGDDKYIVDSWSAPLFGATMSVEARTGKQTLSDITVAGPNNE